MTSVFGLRPGGYKWGFALLLLSVMCYVIGFASPYWSKVNLSTHYTGSRFVGWVRVGEHAGLWEVCYYIQGALAKECLSTGEVFSPGWFSTVKGLECVGLVCLLASCAYAITINWIQSRPRFSRLLEISTALGGLSGSIGITVYINNATDDAMKAMLLDFFVPSSNSQIDGNHVAWAFWLAAAGSGFSMVSSILIAIFNRYPLNIPDPDAIGPIYDPETGLPYIDPSALTDLDLMNAGVDGDVYCIHNQAMAAGFSPPPYDSLVLGKDGFLKPPPYEALQGHGEGQGSSQNEGQLGSSGQGFSDQGQGPTGQVQGSSPGLTPSDAAESAEVAQNGEILTVPQQAGRQQNAASLLVEELHESDNFASPLNGDTAEQPGGGQASEHVSDQQTIQERQKEGQYTSPEDLEIGSQAAISEEHQIATLDNQGFTAEETQTRTSDSSQAAVTKE